MKARILIGVVACAATLGVAGCGGDDDTSSTTTTPTTGATGAGVDEGTAGQIAAQSVAALGLTGDQADCVTEVITPILSETSIEDLQDPAFVEQILTEQKDAIDACENP